MKETLRKIVYAPLVLFPNNLPYRDKIAHASVGTVLFILFLLFGLDLNISLLLVSIIALFKEILDKYVIDGTPDPYDFLATIALPFIYVPIHIFIFG